MTEKTDTKSATAPKRTIPSMSEKPPEPKKKTATENKAKRIQVDRVSPAEAAEQSAARFAARQKARGRKVN